MSVNRLSKVARDLGVGVSTIVDFLKEKGFEIEARPTTKIGDEEYNILLQEFQSDKQAKDRSQEMKQSKVVRQTITIDDVSATDTRRRKDEDDESILIKNVPVDAGLQTARAKEE